MSENNAIIIEAQLMGAPECRVNGAPLEFMNSADSKSARLMFMLLYYADKGVTRSAVKESLYQDSDADFANSFKALLFRLRRQLAAALGIPEKDCVTAKNSVYRLGDGICVKTDTAEFCGIIAQAEAEPDEAKSAALRERALLAHRGELLPAMSAEPWVVFENASLTDTYARTLRQVCARHSARQEYDAAHELFKRALAFFPFDEEWAIGSINALLAQGKYQEALTEFEEITNAVFDELGAYPSEKLMECIRKINDDLSFSLSSAGDLNRTLDEEPCGGAYYCSYPSFVDSYRILRRIKGREEIPMTLVLFTVVDRGGKPLEDKSETIPAMAALRMAISRTLRKSDMFTRYGRAQMLTMLWGMPPELCVIATDRIQSCIADELGGVCRVSFCLLAGADELKSPSPAPDALRAKHWKHMG